MGSIPPISGGGYNYYTNPVSNQEQEINRAIEVFTKAAEESSNGGGVSLELLYRCENALNTIINDPQMPSIDRNYATMALKEFKDSLGNPNADQTLNNIVENLKNMKP